MVAAWPSQSLEEPSYGVGGWCGFPGAHGGSLAPQLSPLCLSGWPWLLTLQVEYDICGHPAPYLFGSSSDFLASLLSDQHVILLPLHAGHFHLDDLVHVARHGEGILWEGREVLNLEAWKILSQSSRGLSTMAGCGVVGAILGQEPFWYCLKMAPKSTYWWPYTLSTSPGDS